MRSNAEELWDFGVALMLMQESDGAIGSIEHPPLAYSWKMQTTLQLMGLGPRSESQSGSSAFNGYHFDSCAWGARDKYSKLPYKKGQKFVSNTNLDFACLRCKCRGRGGPGGGGGGRGHAVIHQKVEGRAKGSRTNRTKLAGRYPRKFCKAFANVVVTRCG